MSRTEGRGVKEFRLATRVWEQKFRKGKNLIVKTEGSETRSFVHQNGVRLETQEIGTILVKNDGLIFLGGIGQGVNERSKPNEHEAQLFRAPIAAQERLG